MSELDGAAVDDAHADEALADLARRAAAGDMDAYTQLVEETRASVRTTIAASVRSAPDVEDLVQEVFLRALVALRKLDKPERVRSWLYAIARNAATDFHRSAQRRPTDPVEAADMEAIDDGELDVAEMVELGELAASVRIGLGRLSPLDATLVAMVAMLGFTPTNIADALGMTPGAAKVALHRARKRLRDAMLVQDAAGQPQRTCAVFQELIDAGDLVPAAVHARSCATCGGRA